MFDATIENVELNRISKYRLTRGPKALTFADVLDLWKEHSDFRRYFTVLLADSSFPAYRWETPGLNTATLHQPFQFVLLNSPTFASRQADAETYNRYFVRDDTDCGVVSFASLSGDATLVVPSPRTDKSAYGHLAAFVRHAPRQQTDALWRIVSETVRSTISEKPLWLSTAGGGVAWLHVRLDSRPKYYGYLPYKST